MPAGGLKSLLHSLENITKAISNTIAIIGKRTAFMKFITLVILK